MAAPLNCPASIGGGRANVALSAGDMAMWGLDVNNEPVLVADTGAGLLAGPVLEDAAIGDSVRFQRAYTVISVRTSEALTMAADQGVELTSNGAGKVQKAGAASAFQFRWWPEKAVSRNNGTGDAAIGALINVAVVSGTTAP